MRYIRIVQHHKHVGSAKTLNRARIKSALLLLAFTFAIGSTIPVAADSDKIDRDWPHPGGNIAHWKYAPLNQINLQNVGALEVAWTWDSADTPLVKDFPALERSQNTTQPIMVNGVVYVTTASSQVAALDAATGEVVAEFTLPSSGRPGSITYAVDGRQYIVLATGFLREPRHIIAFTLPEN